MLLIAVLIREYVANLSNIQCMALSFVLVPRPAHNGAGRRRWHARCLAYLALLSRPAYKAVLGCFKAFKVVLLVEFVQKLNFT